MWSMQSKAFDKSLRRAQNALSLSIDSFNFSLITKKLCWELNPSRNPHWLGNSLPLKYS